MDKLKHCVGGELDVETGELTMYGSSTEVYDLAEKDVLASNRAAPFKVASKVSVWQRRLDGIGGGADNLVGVTIQRRWQMHLHGPAR